MSTDKTPGVGIFVDLDVEPAGSPGEQWITRALRHLIGVDKIVRSASPDSYGVRVATRSLVESLLKHGTANMYAIFSRPASAAQTKKEVHLYCARENITPDIHFHRRDILLKDYDGFNLKAWFLPGENLVPMLRLRSARAQHLFPITSTIHTISYHWHKDSWLTPLVLADTYPCDSIVCTSSAGRRAVKILLDEVESSLPRTAADRCAYRGRLDLIPLGVDTNFFIPLNRSASRLALNIPQDCFMLLYMGRLSAVDKADLFPTMASFKRLVLSNPHRNLLLLLAGGDHRGYAKALRDYVQLAELGTKVLVLENVSLEQKRLLYSAADVFISPVDSIQETFGLTAIEAMACGTPQVVADWNGYRDTVVHRETGFLVPTYWMHCDRDLVGSGALVGWEFDHLSLSQSVAVDQMAFQSSIQCLLNNEPLRLAMAKNSRLRASTLYSLEAIAMQYEALWEELAKIALSVEAPFMSGSGPKRGYYETFGHYASHELSDRSLLTLTEAGCNMLDTGQIPSVGLESSNLAVLDNDIFSELLYGLQALTVFSDTVRDSKRDYDFGSLVNDATSRSKAHPDLVRRHLMWMIKYGLLRVTESPYYDLPRVSNE